MSETDAEFVQRMRNDLEWDMPEDELARLFALARRGAAMPYKTNSTSIVVLTLEQIEQMKREGRLSETVFIPADPRMSWPDATLPPPPKVETNDE